MGRRHHPVHDELIPGPQVDQVVEHDPVDGQLHEFPRSDHPDFGCRHHLEPIQCSFCPQLLDDSYGRVGDQDDPEEGVARLLEDEQRHDEQGSKQNVEPGHDVVADDLLCRPAGTFGDGVDQACACALADLSLGQTAV